MNEKQFAKETDRIIKENRKALVDCYKLYAKDDYGNTICLADWYVVEFSI